MNKHQKGTLYALSAQLLFSIWPIFSFISINYFNIYTTVVLWFGFSAFISFLMILFSNKTKEYYIFIKYKKEILLITFLYTLSVLFSWNALKILGPSLSGLLSRINIILIIISGVIFLKEKFNLFEVISAVIVIIGVFLINYTTGHFVLKGVVLIIFSAVFLTTGNLLVKSKLNSIDPLIIVNYRATFIFLYALIIALILGKLDLSFSKYLIFATIPSVLSVILGHIFTFKAYKIMDVSKFHLYESIRPFLVAFFSFLILKEVLSFFQYLGGIIIIIGITGLIYSHNKAVKNSKLKI